MKEITFPALGEFVETIMKRKNITKKAFLGVQSMGGDNYTKLKKGMI